MPRLCSSSRKSKARASPAKSGDKNPASLSRESESVVFGLIVEMNYNLPWSI